MKILKLLFISLLVMFLTGISCTKEDNKPLCEKNNFGHVTIHNNTSIYLWVDATNQGINDNDETRLAPGGSKVFTVKPGEITIWAASDAGKQVDKWQVDYVYVAQCDEYSYTWTNKKGGDGNSFVENGGETKQK